MYRFTLTRTFGPGKLLAICGLNPSKARDGDDYYAPLDDPSVRRMCGFARSWGYGSLRVVNTNPIISTDPHACPMPSEEALAANDLVVKQAITDCAMFLCAWGANVNPVLESRTLELIRPWWRSWPGLVHHLGLTKGGHPRHPLYMRADTKPIHWDYTPC